MKRRMIRITVDRPRGKHEKLFEVIIAEGEEWSLGEFTDQIVGDYRITARIGRNIIQRATYHNHRPTLTLP